MSKRRASTVRRAPRAVPQQRVPTGAAHGPVARSCSCAAPVWETPWFSLDDLHLLDDGPLPLRCKSCRLPPPGEVVGGGRAASGASPAAGGGPSGPVRRR